jgi:twitching motility protein PilT
VSVEITVEGRSGGFSAQTVDLSRSGALIWITDERFVPPDQACNAVAFSERVAQELGESMHLVLAGEAVTREADVVRVARKGSDETGPMLVACRFSTPLRDEEWQALGLDPGRPGPNGRPDRKEEVVPGLPPGITERRAFARVDCVHCAEIQGDYGTCKAYALNVSANGVLVTIADPEFAPPAEPDQLVRFTKHLGFQFRNGMILRFLESDIRIEADVVRVSERTEGGELMITIGARFRRRLTKAECASMQLDPGSEPSQAPVAAPPLESGTAEIKVLPVDRHTRIFDLMKEAVHLKASDLHIKVGSPPRLRISAALMDVGQDLITPEEAHGMALELMTPALIQRLNADNDLEFAFNIEGVGRYRVAAFKQRGYTGLAIRVIPSHIPDFEELGLPEICRTLADRPRGLVLVTGPTGSGKSHTLAAMVNHINQTRGCHILTMEDPIEFVYADKLAHITQREIGRDCIDFSSALTRALRMDPDVILVGEMRDLETISLALTAAETGHLVFATLHTTSAVNTPDRIIDVFPPNQQVQIRQQLSDSLMGVLAQLLVPRFDEGLVLVQEIVVANEAMRALIREAKTPQLRNMVQTGGKEGMQTLEAGLNDLVKRGLITYEMAVSKANYPKQIEVVESPRSRTRSKQQPTG